jgi:hypothetical protein
MSISDSFRLTMDQVEHTTKSVDLRAKSRELTIYAADRKMQTKRLLHKVWASVTGQTD